MSDLADVSEEEVHGGGVQQAVLVDVQHAPEVLTHRQIERETDREGDREGDR